MKLKTLGLTLIATGFMASSALADMQPIPNPPEKAKHHKAKAKAKKADAAAPAADAKPAAEAKPTMPAKK